MYRQKVFLALAASALLTAAAAHAAGIDMNDPRRALAREDNVRIDAQLMNETISPGSPIAVTYQIENFAQETIAVADKISDATYDEDSRTITLAVGAEVPKDGALPHMVTVAPGERKVFRASATPVLGPTALRASFANAPRYVQVKVTILRDLGPFATLIQNQARTRAAQRLSDAQFDSWMENSDSIFLNALPVAWSPREPLAGVDASQHGRARGGY
jgi:hypothetical protein